MSTPDPLPLPQGVSIHGPYEDAIVAGLNLLEKVIDSQPPEAKKKAWDDFFAFFDVVVLHESQCRVNVRIVQIRSAMTF